MADFVFNRAKGRVAEFFERVNLNEPAGACIRVVPLSTAAGEAQKDDDTLKAVLEGVANEQTEGNWNRKHLTDADIGASTPDDAEDRMEISVPEMKWTPGPETGKNTAGLLLCYVPEEGSADEAAIPLTHHDFAVTADGNEVIINSGEVFRAT